MQVYFEAAASGTERRSPESGGRKNLSGIEARRASHGTTRIIYSRGARAGKAGDYAGAYPEPGGSDEPGRARRDGNTSSG